MLAGKQVNKAVPCAQFAQIDFSGFSSPSLFHFSLHFSKLDIRADTKNFRFAITFSTWYNDTLKVIQHLFLFGVTDGQLFRFRSFH